MKNRIIAIAGKGGVGKTTLSGLIVKGLIEGGLGPVLAIDADPNACLDAALGVSVDATIGAIREEAREIVGKGMSAGISKPELLEMKIAESLVEADDFDLIAMGRPEGPGCYCFANNMLKQLIGQISENYPYTVLDNEAGLENLSRRIVQKLDLFILCADPSRKGIETIRRLHDLAKEMEISWERLAVIVNRIRQDRLPDAASEIKEEIKADVLIGISDDSELAAYGEEGRSLLDLPAGNVTAVKIRGMLNDLNI